MTIFANDPLKIAQFNISSAVNPPAESQLRCENLSASKVPACCRSDALLFGGSESHIFGMDFGHLRIWVAHHKQTFPAVSTCSLGYERAPASDHEMLTQVRNLPRVYWGNLGFMKFPVKDTAGEWSKW